MSSDSSRVLAPKTTFLSLPAELRNDIYAIILAHVDHTIDTRRLYSERKSHRVPAICQVSQQVRAELLPMFYSTHIFDFAIQLGYGKLFLYDFGTWLETLDPGRKKYVKDVRVRLMAFCELSQRHPTRRDFLEQVRWERYGMEEDVVSWTCDLLHKGAWMTCEWWEDRKMVGLAAAAFESFGRSA